MPVASQTIRELLENGVHFGHQTNKWNPKMKKYIFGAKSGIYIIDLQKTEKALEEAIAFLQQIASTGGTVLFVGTKKQSKKIIKEEAIACEMFYVDERWLGGCLTNFNTIRRSIDKLDQLQQMKESEIYASLAKKEKASRDREENKLLKNLGGIREMKQLPKAVVVVDAEDEDIAVKEARKLGIPVVALVDTNCDPDLIDYPIPGNDDAIRSIRYIVRRVSRAIKDARDSYMGGSVKPSKAEDVPEAKDKENRAEEEKGAGGDKGQEEAASETEEQKKEEQSSAAAPEAPAEENAPEEEQEKNEKPAASEPQDEDVIEGDITI